MTRQMLLVFALALAPIAGASQLFITEIATEQYKLALRGEIEEGDYERMTAFIVKNPGVFVRSSFISLDSPGGSVQEAIRIAELVERSALLTVVEKESSCASSCVLIYIAGQMRLPSGAIFVHRPYVTEAYSNRLTMDDARTYQGKAMAAVRDFLEARFVPRSIIDKMMNQSSKEAHRLTIAELKDIGHSTASFEEMSLARCGASPDGFLAGTLSGEQANCIKTIMTVARLESLDSIIGEAATKRVWEEVLRSSSGGRR